MIGILMQKELNREQTEKLEKKYNVRIHFFENDSFPPEEVLAQTEIYVGWNISEALSHIPNLKWIHLYSAGVDRHVVKLREMKNPPRLTNNRGTYAVPLSEHTFIRKKQISSF